MKGLDNGMLHISMFTATKLQVAVDRQESKADAKTHKCHKKSRKLVQGPASGIGQSHAREQAGGSWLESNFMEEVLVDSKLSMSQVCPCSSESQLHPGMCEHKHGPCCLLAHCYPLLPLPKLGSGSSPLLGI